MYFYRLFTSRLSTFTLFIALPFLVAGQNPGKALQFDENVNAYVQLSGSNDFGKPSNFSGEFTCEMWIKNQSSNTWARLFDFGNNTSDFIMAAVSNSSNQVVQFEYRLAGAAHVLQGPILEEFGDWTHLAFTLTGGLAKIYVDGTLYSTSTTAWPTNGPTNGYNNNYLGKSQFNDPYYDGQMDEVRVWNTARTEAQIQDNMYCELSGSEPNLVGYFKMNQGIGNGTGTIEEIVPNFGNLSDDPGQLVNFDVNAVANWIPYLPGQQMDVAPVNQNHIEFRGGDDKYTLANEPNFDLNENITIDFWMNVNDWAAFRPADPMDGAHAIVKYDESDLYSQAFFVSYYDGEMHWGLREPNDVPQGFGGFVETSIALAPKDTWAHYALTMSKISGNNMELEMYKDGVLEAGSFESFRTLFLNNGPVEIGRNMDGKLASVRVWDKRLTAEEVQDAMLTRRYPAGTADLVSQYATYMDFSAGLVDDIGGNNGVRSGSPDFQADPCFVDLSLNITDTLIQEVGGTLDLIATDNYCSAASRSYQWYKNDILLAGETSSTFSTTINTLTNGSYALEATTSCGTTYRSEDITVDLTAQATVLSFDGEDDFVDLPVPYFGHSGYTIETWVKFNETPTNQNIIVLTDENGPEDYYTHQIRVNKDGFFEHGTFDSGAFAPVVLRHPMRAEADIWYHIRVNANSFGGSMGMHINGVAHLSSFTGVNLQGVSGGNRFMIGHSACGHDFFKGDMDELRIWNGSTTSPPTDVTGSENGLLYYFDFNEGVADQDNTDPLIDQVTNLSIATEATTPSAMLKQFALIGDNSNWSDCGVDDPTLVIDLQPQSQEVEFSQGFELTVSSSGADVSYQWYKDGQQILGANSYNYEVASATFANEGVYYVTIETLDDCPARSENARIIVKGSGNVLHFDGDNDKIVIENKSGARTYELWVKFEESVENRHIITSSKNSTPTLDNSFTLYTDEQGFLKASTKYVVNGTTCDRFITNTTTQPVTDQWYQIAVTLGQDDPHSIMVDGVQVNTNGIALYNPCEGEDEYLFIGGSAVVDNGGSLLSLQPLHGELDDIRVWPGTASPAEIVERTATELPDDYQGIMPVLYFKMNRGIANGSNSNPRVDFLPNFGSADPASIELLNFDFEGPESNWSDCSPIAAIGVAPTVTDTLPALGQEVVFDANRLNKFVNYGYQWLRDSVAIAGATDSTYTLPAFMPQDSGTYEVIVSDGCVPERIDTLSLGLVAPTCWQDNAILVDYTAQTSYEGCTIDDGASCGLTGLVQTDPNLKGYCGTDTPYDGNFVAYYLPLTESGLITLTLTDISGVADLFLLGGTCNIQDCFGSSTNNLIQDEYIQADLDGGDYYILVHSRTSTGATSYTLDVDLLDNRCALSDTIVCEQVVTDSNADGSILVANTCNAEKDYSGLEMVYKLIIAEEQTLTISLTEATIDFDLFLYDNMCQVDQCIASSIKATGVDESITATVPAGTYHIVVDAAAGQIGTFALKVQCFDNFEATVLDNDAYIDLKWFLDKEMCVPQDTGVTIKLLTTPNTILAEQTFNTAAQTPDVIAGVFRHYVGPDVVRPYKVRVYNNLTDEKTCDLSATGSTTSFLPPVINSVSQGEQPDSIRLEWTNLSKLSDEFKIYREGQLIATLIDGYTEDSLIVSYTDGYNSNSITSSLQLLSPQEYCIETFSSELDQAYQSVCGTGFTMDIEFAATDGTPTDQVQLSWVDVSAFAESLQIRRDGILIRTLPATHTSYADVTPIFGKNALYSLTLLRNEMEVLEVSDIGSVPRNGRISGKVITLTDEYPVSGVTITLVKDSMIANVLAEVTVATRTTNFNGEYAFDDVFYGISTDFRLTASKGINVFSEETIDVTINRAAPIAENVNFLDETVLNVITSVDFIDTFQLEVLESEDRVELHWDYIYSATDTTIWQLLRSGKILLNMNDAAGKIDSFVDLTGRPETSYNYIIRAIRKDDLDVTTQQRSLTAIYPDIAAVDQWQVSAGLPVGGDPTVELHNPTIYFDWSAASYASENFDGFRIFRNGVQLGEVATDVDSFSIEVAPGSSANYQIRAFREVEGIDFLSDPHPANANLLTTANQLFVPTVADPSTLTDISASDRAISFPVEESITGLSSQFYEDAYYDGFLIERKASSEGDTAYQILDELSKNFIVSQTVSSPFTAVHWDTKAAPGISYDYRVSTYRTIGNSLYKRDTTFTRIAPAIEGPTSLTATAAIGQVDLEWTDVSEESNPINQVFIHYDGYELYRTDLYTGEVKLLTELSAHATTYTDFVNNQVYDIFEDDFIHKDYEYELRPYLTIGEERFYATAASVTEGPLDLNTSEPMVENLIASKDIPNHVKVCWDWNASKQSEFIIAREGVDIATVPYTARAYYDYDAPSEASIRYSVRSLFGGVASAEVYAEGGIAQAAFDVSGRITNFYSGAGVAGATVQFIPTGAYTSVVEKQTTMTDAAGHYYFEDLPYILDLEADVSVSGDNVDFNVHPSIYLPFSALPLTVTGDMEYQLDFTDYQAQELSDEIASIESVVCRADDDQGVVIVNWSPSSSQYDGFEIKRMNQTIGEVVAGNGFSYVDQTGFPGLFYIYEVIPYKVEAGGRVYGESNGASATYPMIMPVENLTATAQPGKNLMRISWSHAEGGNDFYRVRRNGLFMQNINEGEALMWYDSTGVPGQVYQYEVDVVKGSQLSVPNAIEARYKGVGEVLSLDLVVPTKQVCSSTLSTQNHTEVTWSYDSGAALGFELYRDGKLIAEVENDVLKFGNKPLQVGDNMLVASVGNGADQVDFYSYQDYKGLPGTNHTYHVLPYVSRQGARYSSGIESLFLQESVTYPEIAEVSNFSAIVNDTFGTAQISFTYDTSLVVGFELLRESLVLDTILATSQTSYVYNDFTGSPTSTYEYAVRAFTRREGQDYQSNSTCSGSVTYPVVPIPQSLSASQGTYTDHIDVEWLFDPLAFVDSFFVENLTLGTVYSFTSGRRRHTELVVLPENELYEYRARAMRLLNGTAIYSDWSYTVEGWCTKQQNGDETEQIFGECASTRMGTAVAIDGEWAVGAAIEGEEYVAIYRRTDGGWALFHELYNPNAEYPDSDFGASVALHNNTLVVGAPKHSLAYVYEWDGQEWGYPAVLPGLPTGDTDKRGGYSVDVHDNAVVVSVPSDGAGKVIYYEKQADLWTIVQTFENYGNADRIGQGVALSESTLVFGYRTVSSNTSRIYLSRKQANGSWAAPNAFGLYTTQGILMPDAIDVTGDKVVVGDPFHSNAKGRIEIFEKDANDLYQGVTYAPPFLLDGDRFGYSASINEIPSPADDELYVAVGAHQRTEDGLSQSGAAYLYNIDGSTFTLEQELVASDPEEFDEFGTSLALSKDAVIVGVPLKQEYDIGKVEISNLIAAPLEVTATDGQSLAGNPANTTISWVFEGNKDLVAGFNIYRDGNFLAFRDKATTINTGANTLTGEWDDNNGNAGQRYIYSVTTVNNEIPFESMTTSDQGYNAPDGEIRGTVRTKEGFIPVPGVSIKAVGIVKGEVFTYETTTLPNGEYNFTSVLFDSDPAVNTIYKVTAVLGTNTIKPANTDEALLNPQNDPTQSIIDFFDETAYVLTGQLVQTDVTCPVEGLLVQAIVNGEVDLLSETTTDAEGRYSLIVNPNDPDLDVLSIRVADELNVDGVVTTYDFQTTADTSFTEFDNFPFVTEVNYVDEYTYDVDLKVKNTCNNAISTGAWDIRIRTLDGCYDEVYTTDSNGDLLLPLLPLNYVMSVVGVDVPSSRNQQALDYFANFPLTLDLLQLHQDSIETMTKAEIELAAKRQFTYHVAPTIVVGGLDDIICDTETAKIDQGSEYTLTFDVTEIHDGFSCSVEEGFIEINNPASAEPGAVIVPYDKVSESFAEYTFTAGLPNQADPHQYLLSFDYKSDDGVFIGRSYRIVFVAGSVAEPGNGIIVDASSGNSTVPYPLLVLRDPPGDGSSSYISSGQQISYTTTMSSSNETSLAVYAEAKALISDTGPGVEAQISGGNVVDRSIEFANTVTTNNTISTSDDESQIGRIADVIVGAGIVMQYGIIYDFSVGDCDEIIKTIKYGISPNGANTVWNYSVGQIEDIINGYEVNLQAAEAGTFQITLGTEKLTTAQTIDYLQSNLENWQEVLHYHDVKTVPMYYLATWQPKWNFTGSGQETQFGYWQNQLKGKFGSEINGEFVLNEDLIWDQELIDFYNAAAGAMRNLAAGGSPSIWEFPYIGDISQVDLNIPLLDFNLLDLPQILNQPELVNRAAMFGEQVKNITLGGNISIEESINNAQSSTTTLGSSTFVGTELDIFAETEFEFKVNLGFFTGLGGGVTGGVEKTTVKVEAKAGVKNEFKFTNSSETVSSIENSVETGYTLFDDDTIDDFSVAVIQGVSPNSTAYFDFFGGHTSCPPEEGAIFVDKPFINIYDPEQDATAKDVTIQYVPEDETVIHVLRIENGTPIASDPTRELKISLVSSTNSNGAVVTLNGQDLNNNDYIDEFEAGPDGAQDLVLSISRGSFFYEYPDLEIMIEPSCGGGPKDSVTISTYFVNPCSPVSIVQPDDDWVFNQSLAALTIGIQDYDPINTTFDAILQYRRVGAGTQWKDVNVSQLEDDFVIDSEFLAAYNLANFGAFQIPKYNYIWNIPETSDFPDGTYDIRVKMVCDNFTQTLSNVVRGTIARDGMDLFGTPEPADQIWTVGDEISFTFDKAIDCPLIDMDGDDIFIINQAGDTLGFSMGCNTTSNKLVFNLDEPMSTYDGQFLTVSVDNIPSVPGNISGRHDWTFRVVTQDLYWSDAEVLELTLYQDETATLSTSILSNSEVNITNVDITSLSSAAWIQVTSPASLPTTVSPAGVPVEFVVTADQPLGTYLDTFAISGSNGVTPELIVKLNVLAKPPNWEVDPNDYTDAMVVVANWKYDGSTETSTDAKDLISVWVGNEIRGVATIQQTDAFHNATITVFGSPADGTETPLEFRVWDADMGLEFDGHPADTVYYAPGTQRGTAVLPEILTVDSLADLARYLPLKNGWTGFSLYTTTEDMTVPYKLRSLSRLTEGDLLVTSDGFSQYHDSIGWYSFGDVELGALVNTHGFMIYLEEGPDTLRTTGVIADAPDVQLQFGWNWLGFPFEYPEAVNPALHFTQNQTVNDTVKMDYPIPGMLPGSSTYQFSNSSWVGTLQSLAPNGLYKVHSGNPNGALISWLTQNNLKDSESTSRSGDVIVDREDASTWVLPNYATDLVMPIVAEVIIDGVAVSNTIDKVAFFEGDSIRALGSIEYLPELDVYEVSLLAEKIPGSTSFEVRYYDSAADSILVATNQPFFDENGLGTFDDPYEIIFDADPCPDHLVIGQTGDPFVNGRYFEARLSITVQGVHTVPDGVTIEFSAPEVRLEGDLEIPPTSHVVVSPAGCD